MLRSASGAPVATPLALDCSQSATVRWLLTCLTEAGEEESGLMLNAVYGSWLARNGAQKGKRISKPQMVVKVVLEYAKEWEEAQIARPNKIKAPELRKLWTPPDTVWVK